MTDQISRIRPRGKGFLSAVFGLLAAASAGSALQGQSVETPKVPAAQSFSARITHVVDGDTLDATVIESGTRLRIRLEGIDCPEPGQPFSQVARNFVRESVFDQVVQIRVLDLDRYGRLLARIHTPGGSDLSVDLVRAGLAWHYTQYSSDKLLAGAEREARTARRGLWVEPNAVPPWVARRPQPRSEVGRAVVPSSGPFVGNTRSRVFHRPSCRNAGCQNCTMKFATEGEALAEGFRRAGDCFPTHQP